MQERIKQIPTKFVEFWNKYTGVQKTIIISVICVVLLAIGLTTYFVSRPTWVKFNEFNNLNDANAMAKALDDANVSHKSSKERPIARAASGTRLVAVIPGTVLISRTKG